MEFILTYAGPLKSSGNKNNHSKNKELLRSTFAHQLERQWQTNSFLQHLAVDEAETLDELYEGDVFLKDKTKFKNYFYLLVEKHKAHGIPYCPLISTEMSLSCSLDILFLRNGGKGSLINDGDLDGRIKTVFDALSIPKSSKSTTPQKEKYFVLMSDDSLISKFTVDADELLEPSSKPQPTSDCRLVIKVQVKVNSANLFTINWI